MGTTFGKKTRTPTPSEDSDIFLGDDDLELSKLPPEEYYRRYAEWLRAAQATNEQDKYDYSHGVFILDKEPRWDDGMGEEERTEEPMALQRIVPGRNPAAEVGGVEK